MSKTFYKDSCGTYSVETHRNGSATLRCCNPYGKLCLRKDYRSGDSAKRALSRYCGGMPLLVGRNVRKKARR